MCQVMERTEPTTHEASTARRSALAPGCAVKWLLDATTFLDLLVEAFLLQALPGSLLGAALALVLVSHQFLLVAFVTIVLDCHGRAGLIQSPQVAVESSNASEGSSWKSASG